MRPLPLQYMGFSFQLTDILLFEIQQLDKKRKEKTGNRIGQKTGKER